MPCRNPCRPYIHLEFTYSVGPSSTVGSELGPAPPFPQMRVLKVKWSWAPSLVCGGLCTPPLDTSTSLPYSLSPNPSHLLGYDASRARCVEFGGSGCKEGAPSPTLLCSGILSTSSYPGQWSGRFLSITGWEPSVCKSNRLHVDILRFPFIKLRYIL